ncbi:hypothetical protein BRADI_3g01020v3 [Brachypodium distachyon]|uniref:Knottin scorpion toxin-like domain-containing protein n=1 Tax=Brachypodium distachyon TaxID=15368 RepID=I1HW74_BRADI|nr:hypothetical protein BRADI_3g01020v3 [Brachypodium distachyon]
MISNKKPAPLLVLLAILLITTLEMVPEVAAGDELLCDVRLTKCEDVCYKSGKCSRCCKNHRFNHGHCDLKSHCYCYRGPNSGAGDGEQQRMLRVIPASPPPPAARHPPLHA